MITSRLRRLFTPPRVSLRNLRVPIPPSLADVTQFESIIHELGQNNGVFRTTFRRRFANLDPWANTQLRAHFPSASTLTVADWAASDCLTSAEWAESLFSHFSQANLCASDIALSLLEIIVPGQGTFIAEESGHALQFFPESLFFSSTILQLHPLESNRRPWRHWPAQHALRRFHILWNTLPPEAFQPPAWTNASGVRLLRLPLIHPEAEALHRSDPRFSVAEHSAFVPLQIPVDVIRSMNIFNQSYFPPERLATGARAVWHSLRTGGIWIVGRTVQPNPPIHEVSLFARTDSGFTLLSRIGPGSEIESLVLATIYPSSGYPAGFPV